MSETQTPTSPLTLTSAAVLKLQDILAEENNPMTKLRVGVIGGGCSGFQYQFSLDPKVNDDDFEFYVEGIPIIVDSISYQYVVGATLDYSDEFMNTRFVVKNPNSSGQCGCGSSFSVG